MSSSKSILSTVIEIVAGLLSKKSGGGAPGRSTRPKATLRPEGRKPEAARERPHPRPRGEETTAGRDGDSATVQVDPNRVDDVSVGYSPSRNDVPDSGEVIWTWVPYEENDGRGKDRPVLVIGRQSADRVYAVRMTSKPHGGDRDFIGIGSGAWDSQGRESWVDIEQLYSVHHEGMRREAAVLDAGRYAHVAQALIRRYGWARE